MSLVPRFARFVFVLGLLLTGSLVSAAATPAGNHGAHWDRPTLERLAALPIQEGGRVKPLATYARFKLIELSGRTSCQDAAGRRLTALEWLLECFFRPAEAREFKVFRIENPAVMQALGLSDEKPRATFSWAQLEPVTDRLFSLAGEYAQIEARQRSLYQTQVLNLAQGVMSYEALTHAFDFAAFEAEVAPGDWLAGIVSQGPATAPLKLRYSTFLAAAPLILQALHEQDHQDPHAQPQAKSAVAGPLKPGEAERLKSLIGKLEETASASAALAVIPPLTNRAEETWLSPGTLLREAALAAKPPLAEISLLRQLEDLPAQVGEPARFDAALSKVQQQIISAARERGEGRRIGLELFYYRASFFQYSLMLFILGFLVIAGSWLAPRRPWPGRLGAWLIVAATVLLIAGITLRSVIRGRPPVTTLYETTLFVPAVAIVVALIAEFINRKRIALSLAATFGVAGLFLANRFELKDGADTMGSMVAVLNSNFWLATHVTTVTIGYSAGLLAAALAHLTLVGRAFRLRRRDEAFYRSVARMTYGVICFGAFFSFIGTVLGGIWANDSWGRFWGWDPKENGALLIILWNLIILHARLGRYIGELGTAMAAVLGGMVVAFSWWGVNLLGVGLHSYGFTSGVMTGLIGFWTVESGVLLLGLVAWARTRGQAERVPAEVAGQVAPRKKAVSSAK